MTRNNSPSKINKCTICLLNLLIHNCNSYILQREKDEIYVKNREVSFGMGVEMFFALHVNDDRHEHDNVVKETFIITRSKGHLLSYCIAVLECHPGKSGFSL